MTTDNPLLKVYFILVDSHAKPICIDEDVNFLPSVAYEPNSISFWPTAAEAEYANTEFCNGECRVQSVSFVVGKA